MRWQAELRTGMGTPVSPLYVTEGHLLTVVFCSFLLSWVQKDTLSHSQSWAKATGHCSYSPFFPQTISLTVLSRSSPGQHSTQSTSHSSLPSLKLWMIVRWEQETVSWILKCRLLSHLAGGKAPGQLARKSRSGHTSSFTFLLLCVPNTTNSISSVHLDKKELSA